MVDFAGWRMPVQYASIVEEHHATRQAAGMFDVSHMGRLSITGRDAIDWLESLLSRKVAGIDVGRCRYTLVTTDEVILDDALVSREAAASDGTPRLSLVVNASNRERVVTWLRSRLPSTGVALADQTFATAMIAVQGPRAVQIIRGLCPPQDVDRIGDLATYTTTTTAVAGHSATISRTGYTGEDGFEIVVPAGDGAAVWEAIYAAGVPLGLQACGLGARDTLRLEAGMPLYGHELLEDSDPFAIGLGLAVSLDGRMFPGRDRFLAMRSQPAPRVRVGLVFESKRTAREGHAVLLGEREVGMVTSGSFAPTLGTAVAMALVDRELAIPATIVDVVIRESKQSARIVPLPFYHRGG